MANFYYVKNDGTATGDAGRVATTKSTGTFATKGVGAYYSSILDANSATTPPVSGDYVLCSDAHDKQYGATTALLCIDGVVYMSVSDTALDTYSEGATERATGAGYNMSIMAAVSLSEVYFKGVFLISQGTFTVQGNVDNRFLMDQGGLEMTSAAATTILFGRTGLVSLKDCSLILSAAAQYIDARYNVQVKFDNVTLGGGVCVQLFKMLLDGATIEIINSDLTDMGASPTIVSVDDGCWLSVRNSLAALGTTWLGGAATTKRASVVQISSVGIGTGVNDYHYYYDSPKYLGYSEENLTIYRTAGASYSSTFFSTKITTESTVTQSDPQKVALGMQKITASDYTTNITFTAHFARDGSAVALNSDEVWLDVVYKDGSQKSLGLTVSTETDIFATANAPTTETGLWTGLGGTNIQMSVASSAITIGTGAGEITDGWVEAYLYVAVPSIDLYLCPKLELS